MDAAILPVSHLAVRFVLALTQRQWAQAATLLTPAAAHAWPPAALQAAWDRMIAANWGPVLVSTAEEIAATGEPFVWPDAGPPPYIWIYVALWGVVYPYSGDLATQSRC